MQPRFFHIFCADFGADILKLGAFLFFIRERFHRPNVLQRLCGCDCHFATLFLDFFLEAPQPRPEELVPNSREGHTAERDETELPRKLKHNDKIYYHCQSWSQHHRDIGRKTAFDLIDIVVHTADEIASFVVVEKWNVFVYHITVKVVSEVFAQVFRETVEPIGPARCEHSRKADDDEHLPGLSFDLLVFLLDDKIYDTASEQWHDDIRDDCSKRADERKGCFDLVAPQVAGELLERFLVFLGRWSWFGFLLDDEWAYLSLQRRLSIVSLGVIRLYCGLRDYSRKHQYN